MQDRPISKYGSRHRRKAKQSKPEVSAKRRLRAQKKVFIVQALGGKCANCHETNPDKLHFHHPHYDRTYTCGITSKSWEFIWNEIATKEPFLLCIKCNGLDGTKKQYTGYVRQQVT